MITAQQIIDRGVCPHLDGEICQECRLDFVYVISPKQQILKDIQELLKWKKRFCLKIRT